MADGGGRMKGDRELAVSATNRLGDAVAMLATLLVPALIVYGFQQAGRLTHAWLPAGTAFLVLALFHAHQRSQARRLVRARTQARLHRHAISTPRTPRREAEALARDRDRTRLQKAHAATAYALASMVEARDPATGQHITRLRAYTRLLVADLQHQAPYDRLIDHRFAAVLPLASTLHDIGKIAIPDSVLLKPGPLTPAEYDVVRRHAILGAESLRKILALQPENEFLAIGIEVALHHHERWDGQGYPQGLRGQAIPLSARIVAVADVYDALTSERPYKRAYSHASTRGHLIAEAGRHFDPGVVASFLRCEQAFLRVRETLTLPDPVPPESTRRPAGPATAPALPAAAATPPDAQEFRVVASA